MLKNIIYNIIICIILCACHSNKPSKHPGSNEEYNSGSVEDDIFIFTSDEEEKESGKKPKDPPEPEKPPKKPPEKPVNSNGVRSISDNSSIHWINKISEDLASGNVLVFLRLSECELCDKFENTTLKNAKLIERVNKDFIPLKIDISKHLGTACNFRVNYVPALVILNNSEIMLTVSMKDGGIIDPLTLIQEIDKVLKTIDTKEKEYKNPKNDKPTKYVDSAYVCEYSPA